MVGMLFAFQFLIAQGNSSYLGDIKAWPSSSIPNGWLACNGQLLPINQNQALFSIIGTYYGGNGITNFALPDLRGRSPKGVDRERGGEIGMMKGSERVTISQSSIPYHAHSAVMPYENTMATSPVPFEGAVLANPTITVGENTYAIQNFVVPAGTPVGIGSTTTTTVGSNVEMSVVQPSLGITYIICVYGLFPSRQ